MADERGQLNHPKPEDYLQLYNLESYLFDTVRLRFHNQGYLEAFDFFCIIIWKSNRAKSKIALRLLSKGLPTLDDVVADLTKRIAIAESPKDKLRLVMNSEWGFLLPMASAILTVLYPDDFTIYDVRVCGALNNFHELANITAFDKLWDRYLDFKSAVESNVAHDYSLRDKDRFLWAKSFTEQLSGDIKNKFGSLTE